MATHDVQQIEVACEALTSATLEHCYLETLHRSIETAFSELHALADVVGVNESLQEQLREGASHGLNLLYMAEEKARAARKGALTAESIILRRRA